MPTLCRLTCNVLQQACGSKEVVKQSKSQAKVGSKPARVAKVNIAGLPRDPAVCQHSPPGSTWECPGQVRLSSSDECLLASPQPSSVLISRLEDTRGFWHEIVHGHAPICPAMKNWILCCQACSFLAQFSCFSPATLLPACTNHEAEDIRALLCFSKFSLLHNILYTVGGISAVPHPCADI